jgi:prepilin-type N-terminal cleavage/methylation domain-containing protein
MFKAQKNSQLGYTLIEISIGLAVVSLVTASVIMGVEKLLRGYSVNKTITQVAAAAEKIKLTIKRDPNALYATMQNFTATNNNAFDTSVVLSAGTSTATVYNALGYQMGLYTTNNRPWNYDTGAIGYLENNQQFVIGLGAAESSTCFDLASGLEGIAEAVYYVTSLGQFVNLKKPTTSFDVSLARDNCKITAGNLLVQFRK